MTPEEIKALFEKQGEAIQALITLDKKRTDELEKATDAFGKRAAAEGETEDGESEETKEQWEKANDRIDDMEAKMLRLNGASDDDQKDDEGTKAKAAYIRWLRKGYIGSEEDREALLSTRKYYLPGDDGPDPIDLKVMTIGVATTGGYLEAPPAMETEIIRQITLISPVRQIARVTPIGTSVWKSNKRSGIPTAGMTTETGTRTADAGSTYKQEAISVDEMYVLIDVSRINLDDSAYNLETELNIDVAEAMAKKEGQLFLTGTGSGEPEGIITNGDISIVNTGSPTNFTMDGILDLTYTIKEGYTPRAAFLLKRTSMKEIRKLKDGEGNYLWQRAVTAGQPSSLDGYPLYEANDVPAVAGNAKSAIFGDFYAGYRIVDRIGIATLRDPFTQATTGTIRFFWYKRFGGGVIQPEALVIQKIAS